MTCLPWSCQYRVETVSRLVADKSDDALKISKNEEGSIKIS
jgi:hypothetical protein